MLLASVVLLSVAVVRSVFLLFIASVGVGAWVGVLASVRVTLT